MEPVILSWLKEPTEVRLQAAVPDAWYRLAPAIRPWPADVAFRVVAGGSALAKRAPKLVALYAPNHGFVVRRSLAAPALADVDPRDFALRPVTLIDTRGAAVDEDFALLDVLAHAPLDRSASDADWHGGHLHTLRAAHWGEGRRPSARLFRVGEVWQEVAAHPAVASALAKATDKWIGARPISPTELAQRAVFTVHPDYAPPLDPAPDAESAFWRVASGAGSDADRVTACTSPLWGYWLARSVDRAPAADTRAAALGHPVTAALFAVAFDDGPSDDARAACASHYWSAETYAKHVDRALHHALEGVLRDSGHDLDLLRREIAAVAVYPRIRRH